MTDRSKLLAYAEWYRFTGIAGFKRFMPGRSIKWATERGYAWVRWYEPMCSHCAQAEALS